MRSNKKATIADTIEVITEQQKKERLYHEYRQAILTGLLANGKDLTKSWLIDYSDDMAKKMTE